MTYHVYMLKSLGKKSVTYVGHTNNLRKRITLHNNSKGAKSTRGLKWKIIYKKRFYDKRLAMSFEYRLKKDKKKENTY